MLKGKTKALKEQLAAVGRLLNGLDSARRDAKYMLSTAGKDHFAAATVSMGAAAYLRNTRAYRPPLECQNTACPSRGAGYFDDKKNSLISTAPYLSLR